MQACAIYLCVLCVYVCKCVRVCVLPKRLYRGENGAMFNILPMQLIILIEFDMT